MVMIVMKIERVIKVEMRVEVGIDRLRGGHRRKRDVRSQREAVSTEYERYGHIASM